MPFNNYSPTYVFKGDVQCENAPTEANDLVRKTDVSGLSFISSVDSDYFSVDSNGELSASNLLISDVEVNTTDSSLANYVSNSASSDNLGVGDVVILTNPTPSEMYIVKSGSGTNVSDYQEIQSGLTQGEVLSHISAGTGINITSGGEISTTITQYTDADARGAFSGGTGISILNGVISTSITQYADSDARDAVGAATGGGLNYDSTPGEFSVDNDYFRKEFLNQSLTADTAKTLVHNLGEKYVHVSAYDSNDRLIHLEVALTDANNLTVTSVSALTGVNIIVSI